MDYHFIYLIKEKDDIDNDVQIYKIGKSCQANTKRVASYPSGSHLLLQVACDDCHSMETLLIKEFKYLFKLARGREYFGGDPYKMINLIFFIVQIEVNPHKIEYMMTDKYNMSLVCKWDNDSINYSFNNKDNILDEYNRDLIASKQKYKHLEIKYNNSVHDSNESIHFLEKVNKGNNEKIDTLTEVNKSLCEINTKIVKDHNEIKKKYKSSNRLYYGLFTYMLYNMSYNIYMYPYSVTNWLLLSGSPLFICMKHFIHP